MSNKVKISDVLHLAADRYLASDYIEYFSAVKNRFSCCAVSRSLDELITEASQGARYAWLKFCAMLYEEQGE